MTKLQRLWQHRLENLKEDLYSQAYAIREVKQNISFREDAFLQTQGFFTELNKISKFLQNKVDDLENPSRNSHLRIIGLPETYTLQALY